jgi:broad specificity phosphatase PhoE
MRKVILIRHAESEANVGITNDHGPKTVITENGKKQAEGICPLLDPSYKIICSHFIRTQQTADIATTHFTNKAQEIWTEIGENISTDYNADPGKEIEHFKRLEKDYWDIQDVHFQHSPNTESFRDFADRGRVAVLKMKNLEENAYVFTHGYMTRITRLYLQDYKNWSEIKKAFIKKFDEEGEVKFYENLRFRFINFFNTYPLLPVMGNCNMLDISESLNEFVG